MRRRSNSATTERETPFGVNIQEGDKLALIGYMAPVAKQFAGKVADTVVFDRVASLRATTT